MYDDGASSAVGTILVIMMVREEGSELRRYDSAGLWDRSAHGAGLIACVEEKVQKIDQNEPEC